MNILAPWVALHPPPGSAGGSPAFAPYLGTVTLGDQKEHENRTIQ